MALLAAFSCKKQESASTAAAPVAVDIYNMEEVEPTDQPVNLDSAILYVDGKVAELPSAGLKSDALDDSLIFVYSGRFPGKQFCFTSTAGFEKWAKSYKSTEKLIAANNKLNNLAQKAVAMDAISYYDKTGEILPEYTSLFGDMDAQPTNLKAHAGIELWTQVNYGGWGKMVVLTTPNLRNMRNNSMSYVAYGGAMTALCDDTWYRGARYYAFDAPGAYVNNLGYFNNRAESVSIF